MFQFFSAIAGIIGLVADALVSFIVGIISLLITMVRAVAWLFSIIVFMPPFLTAFIAVPVSLAIMYQVINKGD